MLTLSCVQTIIKSSKCVKLSTNATGFFRTTQIFARCITTSNIHRQQQQQQQQQQLPDQTTPQNTEEWRTIFHLPLIRSAAAFNRVKIPYGAINAMAIPAVYALEQCAYLQPQTTVLCAAIGLTSWTTMAISSLVIKDIVGFIYINDTNDKLKFAILDYWGKRTDVVHQLDDLVPDCDQSNPSKVDYYQYIRLHSDEKVKYKLLQRYGRIDDPVAFATIFGE